MSPEHPTRSQLESFVSGKLEVSDQEHLIQHLESCDACLASLDQLWSERSPLPNAVSPAELTADAARRMERRLFQRMHLSSLVSQLVRLAFQSPTRLVLGLIRPTKEPIAGRNPEE